MGLKLQGSAQIMPKKSFNPKAAIALSLIILFGFILRAYNIDFPSLGYHNMKENEYLSMAQEMLRTGDLINRRIYFYNAFQDKPLMKLYPQPPLVSYQILLLWKALGQNLWGPRLFNVVFGLVSILAIYFTAYLFFKSRSQALFCAFLLAIMPLAVFFSRNLQPESPAFFFMLLGSLFYLKFCSSFKKRHLFFGGIAFSAAWLYKFSFFIGTIPFLFCFPYTLARKNIKELPKLFISASAPYIIIIFSILWLKSVGQWEFVEAHRIHALEVFTAVYWHKFWRTLWWYATGENFTVVFFLTSIAGMAVALVRRGGLLNRYLKGWFFAFILYCMIFSDFINQHNYYQMPFLGIVCIASVYALSVFAQAVKRIADARVHIISKAASVKINSNREVARTSGVDIISCPVPQSRLSLKGIFLVSIVTVLIAAAPFIRQSIMRMYSTVFLGQDVAGESLKEFTRPEERIFLLTHFQGYAIARYARRYVGWDDNLAAFKEKEQKFNIRYICFYPAEYARALQANNPSLFEYVRNNYHVKEVGLTQDPQQLYYIILEKGEGSDPKDFLQSFSGPMRLKTIYKMFGQYVFLYTLRP